MSTQAERDVEFYNLDFCKRCGHHRHNHEEPSFSPACGWDGGAGMCDCREFVLKTNWPKQPTVDPQ
jgi:hypothetical protein